MQATNKGEGSGATNIPRRKFLKYAVAGVAVAGAAVIGGSAYYKYSYLPSQTPVSVSLSYSPGPFATALLQQVALKQRFDLKNGLNLDWVPLQTNDLEVAALIKGSTNFTVTNFGTLAAAVAAGNPLTGFLCFLNPTNAIVAAENAPAKTVEDLKNQTLGIFTRPAPTIAVGAALLKKQGITFDLNSVKFVTAPYGALAGSLQGGKLQYAEIVEPYVTQLVVTGKFRVLASMSDINKALFGEDIWIDAFGATQDYASNHRRTVTDMIRTMQDTESHIGSNPDLVRDWYIQNSGIKDESVLDKLVPSSIDKTRIKLLDKTGISRQNQLLKVYSDYGLLSQVPSSFLTDSYNP